MKRLKGIKHKGHTLHSTETDQGDFIFVNIDRKVQVNLRLNHEGKLNKGEECAYESRRVWNLP